MNISGIVRVSLLFLLVSLFPAGDMAAQIIDEKEVHPSVMDGYTRRFRRATEPVWEIKGANYVVTFKFRGKENYAEFEIGGKMIVQRTQVDFEELRPNTQSHLKKKYRGQVMRKGEFIQEMPNKRYYQVEMVPRRLRDDPNAPVTTVRFSNTGQFMSEGTGAVADEAEAAEEKIEIPSAITRDFNRKARNAADVVWSDVDTAYRADFKTGGNDAFILYTHEGVWLYTSIRMNTRFRGLHQGIQRWFAENIEDFTYLYVEDVSEAPRDRFFIVVILDKADDPPAGSELLPTRILFTRAGRHVATYYPDYDIEELTERGESRSWARLADRDPGGDGIGESVNPRELPTKAQTFLNGRYDHEWRYEVCRVIPDDTHGMLYQVVMRLQGRNVRHEHYFDIHGNLLQTDD